MSNNPDLNNPRFEAAIRFIQRTGAASIQIRYSDDELPVIWFVVAEYDGNNPTKITGYDADAGATPVLAILRLCERLADGGMCMHCKRPTGFDPDSLDTMPMNDLICWYQFDPGAGKFIRGCG